MMNVYRDQTNGSRFEIGGTNFRVPIHGEGGVNLLNFWKIPKIIYREEREEDAQQVSS